MHVVVKESLLLCGIDPPWDLSFGWSQIEAVIELLFLFSGGPTSNHTCVQMRGDQVCDAESTYVRSLRARNQFLKSATVYFQGPGIGYRK